MTGGVFTKQTSSPDPKGYFGVRVHLGDPALSTMALYMQRLESGVQTRPLQTTANRIYCAVEGTGTPAASTASV